jgi:hypothetical protein
MSPREPDWLLVWLLTPTLAIMERAFPQFRGEPAPGVEPGTSRLQVGCAASCAMPACRSTAWAAAVFARRSQRRGCGGAPPARQCDV